MKNQRFTPSGCKDIGIRKFEFGKDSILFLSFRDGKLREAMARDNLLKKIEIQRAWLRKRRRTTTTTTTTTTSTTTTTTTTLPTSTSTTTTITTAKPTSKTIRNIHYIMQCGVSKKNT